MKYYARKENRQVCIKKDEADKYLKNGWSILEQKPNEEKVKIISTPDGDSKELIKKLNKEIAGLKKELAELKQ